MEVPKIIDSSEIIVSTLLAARGVDINTTERVEDSGGMHVIVSFLPKNQRVQEQAFGRAARKGKKGTCQMILNRSHVEKALGRHVNENYNILKFRDDANRNYQITMKNKYITDTLVKDELFSKFSQYLNSGKIANLNEV